MDSIAFQSTKWSLAALTRLVKADFRLHNLEAIEDDMSIIFVVNHFTRLETLLLPYFLYKHTGLQIWSLADAALFEGHLGQYMNSMGTLSTRDPDRDSIIVAALLEGRHPWIIFPEGAMIKDKKVVNHAGMFSVWNNGKRRPPHTGAATLALRAEYFRQKLQSIHAQSNDKLRAEIVEKFGLDPDNIHSVLEKRTVIIPVNITYYPIRSHENLILKVVRSLAGHLSQRAIEELSVEGTVLSNDTDIDIRLGTPIVVADYLTHPDYEKLISGEAFHLDTLEQNPKSILNDTTRKIMLRYMSDIYTLTTINYDHIFATIIRYQRARSFTERAYRNRIFLCVYEIQKLGLFYLHTLLSKHYQEIVYEDHSPRFNEFISVCLDEKILQRNGSLYIKDFNRQHDKSEFKNERMLHLSRVIANEIEPLKDLTRIIRDIANMPRAQLSQRIRQIFIAEDLKCFDQAFYAALEHPDRKPRTVGEPFLLHPKRIRGGIVLVHGYLSAPQEILELATYLYKRNYLVYGVRLQGHGTSPQDLATATWQDWYESVNRGYTIIKSYTDHIIVGGFSTGGVLALLAAARKGDKIRAVFAINAPRELKKYSAHLAPAVVTMNTLLQKLKGVESPQRIFVDNHPENEAINYLRNPVIGVQELDRAMSAMNLDLPKIVSPTFLIQGSRDPIVCPSSGQYIFDRIGTADKQLLTLNRDRHGIVLGGRSEEVFEHIDHFLKCLQTRGE